MLKYYDTVGHEITELAALEAIEQLVAMREYTNNLMMFIKKSENLTDEQNEEFDEWVREFNNLLDYCSPKGEPVRIDPETYKKLQEVCVKLINIFGEKDESYYYHKGMEYASEHHDEAIEMAMICEEIHNKYELLKEA